MIFLPPLIKVTTKMSNEKTLQGETGTETEVDAGANTAAETTTVDENKSTPAEGGEADASAEAIAKSLENDGKPNKDVSPKGREDGGTYFKKVGNHEFKTSEEYDTWSSKNYGEVSRLHGENKKLQEKIEADSKQNVETKEPKVNISAIRDQIKTQDFFEENPDASSYKTEMAAFIRAGKAVDENGKPSLSIAYEKSLRADGKEIQHQATQEDPKSNVKKIMKSGGSSMSGKSDANYQSDSDIKSLSDFADKAILG